MCKEADMSAAVQEVKEGKLKLLLEHNGLLLGSLKRLVTGAVKSNFICMYFSEVLSYFRLL